MNMVMNAVLLNIEGEGLASSLQEWGDNLTGVEGDVVLDLSSVRRVDPADLTALTAFADQAAAKSVKVELRGVGIDVYRVLKLARVAKRFSRVS